MTKTKSKQPERLLLFVIFFIYLYSFSNTAFCQTTDSVIISAVVEKSTIPKDQDLKFTVTLTWNTNLADINPENPSPPTCENFTVIGNFYSNDTKASDKGIYNSNHYGFILKPEKVGLATIGPVTIKYSESKSGEEKSLSTNPIEVTITKPLSDKLYPVKVAIRYLVYAICLFIPIFIIIKFFKSRKLEKEKIKALASIPTVDELYIKQLKSAYSRIDMTGKKEYCSSVMSILKKFLYDKFNLKFIGATTDKIISSLTTLDLLKQDDVDLLISIFDFCDKVKFAGNEPDNYSIVNIEMKAESFITKIKELDLIKD
jgi:hypothetical protein